MNFGIYLFGYLIVIAGALYAMRLAHVPSTWTIAVTLILLGAGILTGVMNTRTKDKS